MRDRDVVAALVAGGPDGSAALYDGYAANLYGYCLSLLGDATDAASAVQDTLTVAGAMASSLHSPDRLRPWLYALARNDCHSRQCAASQQSRTPARTLGALAARPAPAGPLPAGAVAAESVATSCATDGTRGADTVIAGSRAELEQLIRGALAGTGPADREVAELSLWHGLAGADLASVLGVPPNLTAALVQRARNQLGRALGDLLAAPPGGRDCPVLDTLAGLAPPPLPPPGTRACILSAAADESPEAAERRRSLVSRSGPFDPDGFPVQIAPAGRPGPAARDFAPAGVRGFTRRAAPPAALPLPEAPSPPAGSGSLRGSRWRGGSGAPAGRGKAAGSGAPGARGAPAAGWPAVRRVPAVVAVAVVLLLAGAGGVTMSLLSTHADGASAAGQPGGTTPFGLPGSPASGGSADRSAASASRDGFRPAPPAATRPGSPGSPARGSGAGSATPGSPGPPSPSPSGLPVLAVSPSLILMQPASGSLSGSFTLTARSGPVSYAISAPASAGLRFSVPLQGKVSPGQPLTVTVTCPVQKNTALPATIAVNAASITLTQ